MYNNGLNVHLLKYITFTYTPMTLPSLPILPLFSLFFQFSLFFPVLYYPSKYVFPIFLTFRVNMTITYRCSLVSNRIFLREGGIVSIAVKIQHEHSDFFSFIFILSFLPFWLQLLLPSLPTVSLLPPLFSGATCTPPPIQKQREGLPRTSTKYGITKLQKDQEHIVP